MLLLELHARVQTGNTNCQLELPCSAQGSNMCTESLLVSAAHSLWVNTASFAWGVGEYGLHF